VGQAVNAYQFCVGGIALDYSSYPAEVLEDVVRLQRRIRKSGVPAKKTDQNLIIATWNIRALSEYFESWDENPGSPKRNRRALVYIAEVIRHFDVVAIQELKRKTIAVRTIIAEFLGPHWDLILSDITVGGEGNTERLAFLFDTRRVNSSGLAGEIVLPPPKKGIPAEQFDRTPYIVGFETSGVPFTLLTAHIKYGKIPQARIGELKALADFTANEIRDRSLSDSESRNLIVLGDFNIDKRGDNPLFSAFVSTGLYVPKELLGVKTTYGKEAKHYDQIAWFRSLTDLSYNKNAGVVDFMGAVFRKLTRKQASYRVSDHYPIWAEFRIDKSTDQIAAGLNLEPSSLGEDPLLGVPD